MTIKSIGIDYSLSCPSMCIETENAEDFHYLTDKKKYEGTFRPNITGTLHKGYLSPQERYENIAEWVIDTIKSYYPEHIAKITYPLINLEDYSFASKGKTFHIAENMGMLKYKFYKLKIPFNLIAPSSVKKYATGKGNVNKLNNLKSSIADRLSNRKQKNKVMFDKKNMNAIKKMFNKAKIPHIV